MHNIKTNIIFHSDNTSLFNIESFIGISFLNIKSTKFKLLNNSLINNNYLIIFNCKIENSIDLSSNYANSITVIDSEVNIKKHLLYQNIDCLNFDNVVINYSINRLMDQSSKSVIEINHCDVNNFSGYMNETLNISVTDEYSRINMNNSYLNNLDINYIVTYIDEPLIQNFSVLCESSLFVLDSGTEV